VDAQKLKATSTTIGAMTPTAKTKIARIISVKIPSTEETMSDRCSEHNITRCVICASLESKGKKPQPPFPEGTIPGSTKLSDGIFSPEPPFTTSLDIDAAYEGYWTPADGIFSPEPPFEPPSAVRPGQFLSVDKASDFYQVADDSHAAKVQRAANAFAEAAKIYAVELANVARVKAELMKADARLDEATRLKETQETALKNLVNGE
jgi:hypothetical protein